MPERESFMKLRSSKAAICTGAAVVMFLMPVVPEVAVAKLPMSNMKVQYNSIQN